MRRVLWGVLGAVAVVLVPASAEAYSCVEPDDSRVQEFVEGGDGLFTGRLVEYDDDSQIARFDDVTVWRGDLLGPRAAVTYSILYASDVHEGNRYHVRIEGDGTASACTTYLADGEQGESILPHWPTLDSYLLAIQSGPGPEVVGVDEANAPADATRTRVVPWVAGGAGFVVLAAVVWWLRRRSRAWT